MIFGIVIVTIIESNQRIMKEYEITWKGALAVTWDRLGRLRLKCVMSEITYDLPRFGARPERAMYSHAQFL